MGADVSTVSDDVSTCDNNGLTIARDVSTVDCIKSSLGDVSTMGSVSLTPILLRYFLLVLPAVVNQRSAVVETDRTSQTTCPSVEARNLRSTRSGESADPASQRPPVSTLQHSQHFRKITNLIIIFDDKENKNV